MTRKPRKQYKDATYHVMAKGNQGSFIFQEKSNKRYFLECLEQGSRRFDVEIFAFCIMGNHYHLLLRTKEANLSSMMHYLGTSYASRLRDQGNLGHIFSGRYKSIIVGSDQQALFVSRYIHLNPKKAGIVDFPEEYQWSSCISYILEQDRFDWISRAAVLGLLSTSPAVSRRKYVDFLIDPHNASQDYPRFPDNVLLAKTVFGGSHFSGEETVQGGRSPIEILHGKVLETYGENCLSKGRTNSISANIPRLLFVFAAKECLLATNNEIGQALNGMCISAVSRYLKQAKELLEEENPYSARMRAELGSFIEVLLR